MTPLMGNLKVKFGEDAGEDARRMRYLVVHWLQQIEDSLAREKDWRKRAKECVELYEGRHKTSFNILYSNTETLVPALYSATPKPAVMRRYKNVADPVAKAAAEVVNRALNYQMDTNDEDCADFDDVVSDAVLAALVPGRGAIWYRYDAKFEELPTATDAEEAREELEENEQSGEDREEIKRRKVKDEYLKREVVPWDMFTQGFARQWTDVPWVARAHFLSRQELEDRFGEVGTVVTVSSPEDQELEGGVGRKSEDKVKGAPAAALVWEIWDKRSKQVIFVSPGLADQPLEIEDDPLQLQGFFPCPKPLVLTRQLSGLTPQTLYAYYSEQAEELEVVTKRLRGLIRAMRVRGMYNALIDDIANVLDAEENTLKPITNAAGLDGGSLDRSIWMVPIEMYVPAIQELWNQREQLKGVIYEITGISDIIRGSTNARETATAQNIKSRWGTVRLQDMQKKVQKYVRSMIRLEAEIMCEHYGADKFRAITEVELPTNEQKAQVQMAMQQQQVMQQPGQPPQPPDPRMEAILAAPSWEDVAGFLKDDLLRQYRLDIESDSTLADDLKADQDELTGMMTALVQLMQGLTPAVQNGFLTFDTAKGVLVGVARRFRLGSDVETALETAQQPPPPQEDQGKRQQAQLQVQMQQQQMQVQQAQMAQAAKDRELDAQVHQQEAQAKLDQLQMEMQTMQLDNRQKTEQMLLKHTLAMKQMAGKMAVEGAKADAAVATANAKERVNLSKPGPVAEKVGGGL